MRGSAWAETGWDPSTSLEYAEHYYQASPGSKVWKFKVISIGLTGMCWEMLKCCVLQFTGGRVGFLLEIIKSRRSVHYLYLPLVYFRKWDLASSCPGQRTFVMSLENFQAGWASPQEAESQGSYSRTQSVETSSPYPRTGKFSDHSLILIFNTYIQSTICQCYTLWETDK